MWRSGDIILERLQARVWQAESGTDEKVALRLKLGQLLGGAELYPPEMPPSAILMIQRLKDPLPGRMLPDSSAVRVDPEWERAVRGALSDLWRTAARPDRRTGAVPDDADAVAFTGPAELLACVAAALVAPGARVRWWFRALINEAGRSGGRPLTPATVLGADARFLPAVMERLVAWGQAERVLEAVWPTEAMALLAALARAFGLPEGQVYLGLSGAPADGDAGTAAAGVPVGSALPVQRLLPYVLRLRGAGALSREQRGLLGLALALCEQPALVRADGGLAAVLQFWLQDPVALTAAALFSTEERKVGLVLEERESLGLVRPSADISGPRWPPVRRQAAEGHGRTPPEAEGAIGGPGVTPDRPAPRPAPRPTGEAAGKPAEAAPGIATRLAGLFYLINLPVPPAPEGVSPWACLEVLGRGLLAEPCPDPAWAALAALAGREPGDPPGPAGDPDLQGWLEEGLPGARARLLELLRTEEPGAAAAMLRAPGWLCASRSHIDILMDLESISVPVRMAGLDADPGWRPEYGRVIQFHFR